MTDLTQLAVYKQRIDDDIAAYADYVRATTRTLYGRRVLEAEVEVFLDLLARGGKRLRGALVMAGYQMCGGTNQKMIVQAARAIEMLHAYILMIDDIQDRSDLRRGKPSAHKMIQAYHAKQKFHGDPVHTGISLALNAAIAGAHGAQAILANLDVDPELRLKAISITNRTMAITAHGQTLDIINELVAMPNEADIDRILDWKSGLYSITNPLHVGMVLAGAGCRETDAITPFSAAAGKTFQITDDILGIYGDQKDLGKTPGDDIREGKGTMLTLYALKHAKSTDKAFLQKCLGNPKLTIEDFDKCKKIIQDSGALAHARKMAAKHLDEALTSLDKTKNLWSQEGSDFLKGLARALQNRVS